MAHKWLGRGWVVSPYNVRAGREADRLFDHPRPTCQNIMQIDKFRKVKTVELTNWKSMSDTWGEPTIMFNELLWGTLLNIGDRITIDLRVMVERKEK